MARQVNRDYPTALTQVRNQIPPIVDAAAPSVNKDHRFAAFAITLVMETRSIERRIARLGWRLLRTLRARRRRQQQPAQHRYQQAGRFYSMPRNDMFRSWFHELIPL